MNILKKILSITPKPLLKRNQASHLSIPNVWTEINNVEDFGEMQMMKMEDGNIIFMSVGLDTTKVFVASNLESLESFSELASYSILPTGDRRRRGEGILQRLRATVGFPKSIEELRRNLKNIDAGLLEHASTEDEEEIYEFGRKNRIRDMNKDWLRRKLTIEEEKALYLRVTSGIPSGALVSHLKNFLAHRQDRDELWEFSTSEDSWKIMAGRAGIAIVRSGEIFDRITTQMN
jgi:hypothetical protein